MSDAGTWINFGLIFVGLECGSWRVNSACAETFLKREGILSQFTVERRPSLICDKKKNFLPGSEEKVERRGYHEGCQEVDFHNFSDKWK